jgi:hypothetical protein
MKLTLALTAAMLVLGSAAFQASAQTQLRGAGTFQALKNATPFVRKAACNGSGGACCGPGYVDRCFRRTGSCCGCEPC